VGYWLLQMKRKIENMNATMTVTGKMVDEAELDVNCT
jgi:hypothetical protein